MNNSNQMHPLHDITDGFMNTIGGRKVSLLNPQPEQIYASDIIHALCRIPRFGGHISSFYSVGHHTLLVLALVSEKSGGFRPAEQYAILHDTPEAYLGDIISPLKYYLGDIYKDLEKRMFEVICERFGLDYWLVNESFVKDCDRYACEIEHYFLQVKEVNPELEEKYSGYKKFILETPIEAAESYLNCLFQDYFNLGTEVDNG